uniref:[histone H3]-lysine(4) N-trimethyltransferase n=1 Tax=Panagrellus redivivus TaxID=6233 RepID=A0A7E4VNM6_PANRE
MNCRQNNQGQKRAASRALNQNPPKKRKNADPIIDGENDVDEEDVDALETIKILKNGRRFIVITKDDEEEMKEKFRSYRERRRIRRSLPRRRVTMELDQLYKSNTDPAALYEHALKLANSSIHGKGVYAICDIQPRQKIIEYIGELILEADCDDREKHYLENGLAETYLFTMDDGIHAIDGTRIGNVSRYINHSCDPNCVVKTQKIEGLKHLFIVSRRHIEKGEELTYDYHLPEEEEKIPCLCGAKKCRKFLN